MKLLNLFKKDKVIHDNVLFRLHHQVNFFVILVGVIFIFGENYLNGKAIICKGGDPYTNQFCWLHGTGHLHPDMADGITGMCTMDQEEVTEERDRQTHYYIWLPFLLLICMGVVKIPRVIWKNVCERGIMKSLSGEEGTVPEKIAQRFRKLCKHSFIYFLCFAACELLNIAAVVICFHILDSPLNGKFLSYGINVQNFYNTKLTDEELRSNPDLETPNPMCNLFPTEVACNICTGSIGGGCNDKSSILCILSNNLFNQYFFLILWFWWGFLLIISILGVIYRATQISIPAASKLILHFHFLPHGLESKVSQLSLRPSDFFLLGRLASNVKGSVMEEVIKELISSGNKKKDFEMGNIDGGETLKNKKSRIQNIEIENIVGAQNMKTNNSTIKSI